MCGCGRLRAGPGSACPGGGPQQLQRGLQLYARPEGRPQHRAEAAHGNQGASCCDLTSPCRKGGILEWVLFVFPHPLPLLPGI